MGMCVLSMIAIVLMIGGESVDHFHLVCNHNNILKMMLTIHHVVVLLFACQWTEGFVKNGVVRGKYNL